MEAIKKFYDVQDSIKKMSFPKLLGFCIYLSKNEKQNIKKNAMNYQTYNSTVKKKRQKNLITLLKNGQET